jgi:polyisoprenoid-binding protein YceI
LTIPVITQRDRDAPLRSAEFFDVEKIPTGGFLVGDEVKISLSVQSAPARA